MVSSIVPSWLRYLNLEQLTHDFHAGQLPTALRHRFVYEIPPALSEKGVLTATLRGPAMAQAVTVKLSERKGYGSLPVGSTCSCGKEYGCGHELPLLVDLALSPALREAIGRGDDVAAHLAALPGLREQARRDHVVHRALSDWGGTKREVAAASPEYSITVYDTTKEHHAWQGPSSSLVPLLEVRPRLPGQNVILEDKQRQELRFPPVDTQILRQCQAIHDRKGFHVQGASATLALDLLRQRLVRLEKGPKVIFAESPVHVSLSLTRLPRWQVGRRNTAVHHPQRDPARYLSADQIEKDKVPPDDPDLLVEVPALVARWFSRDGSLDVASADAVLFCGIHSMLYVPDRTAFYPLAPAVDVDAAWRFFVCPSVEVPEGQGATLYRALRTSLHGAHVSLPPPVDLGLSPAERPEFVVRIDGSPLDLKLELLAQYSGGAHVLMPGPSPEQPESWRDLALEAAALDRLLGLPLSPGWDVTERAFLARGESAAALWPQAAQGAQGVQGVGGRGALAGLREGDPPLTLLLPERLRRTRARGAIGAHLRIRLEGGWFAARLDLDAEGIAPHMEAVRKALAGKRRWVELTDGSLAQISEELGELLSGSPELVKDAGQDDAGEGAFAQMAAHQLGDLGRFAESGACQVELDDGTRTVFGRMKALLVDRSAQGDGDAGAVTEAQVPEGLCAELRPYQRTGLAWLQLLDALGTGGVLADDMGLGKTLMALAFLLWRKQAAVAPLPPTLVVCPTSVTVNWVREAARFTPQLQVALLTGDARRLPEALRADLLVTTYGILRRDVEVLAGCRFGVVILDEAQFIKNAGTATAQAARRLQADRRLALSGTPIENRLSELWSLLHFTNPGMLGSREHFAREFEQPILAESRGPAARRLKAVVRPFVLRRSKQRVLSDLPPKQEIELPCLLGPEQRRRYDALSEVLREELGKKIASEGLGKNHLSFLAGLLRLRQMACDPRLLDATFPRGQCAKRQVFVQLVRDLLQEGRRALVFSQFVELLTLWRRDLEREGVAYEYLDGSTGDRAAVVDRFQKGDAPLFLISLKAGGTGLNLTAADTVIHCDPWWNPAVEDQATDRAHRIGQERPVTVYRLVAAGTVEDRVQQLKERKRQLTDAVLDDEAGALRGLGPEDVDLLLSAATVGDLPDGPEDGGPSDGDDGPEVSLGAPGGTSLLQQASAEVLDEIRVHMKAWQERTGKKTKDLAKLVMLNSYAVGRLLAGKLERMPAQQAERLLLILRANGP